MAEQEKKPATYYDIFAANKYNINDITKKSYSWYTQQALLISRQGFTAKRVINNPSGIHPSKVIPGKLYMFAYDAKHKDTLPYWDKFPLLFPFNTVKGGFIGLNMHYMPVPFRIKLLDRLTEIDGSKALTKRVKLQLSWQLITGASSLKLLESCVHMYLYSQVRSQFREIERVDWATAMMMPNQQFVGANSSQVWKDSMKKAGYM
jgi:hypothetical protein